MLKYFLAKKVSYDPPIEAESVPELINIIANFLVKMSFILVPLMVIISAFYFLFSGGDPKKIETGKRILLWTVVGLTVILLSSAITGTIKNILEGDSDTQDSGYYQEMIS